ncbi:MAG: OmpA family protein [Limnohabitans sp.]|nr:OmpA family protein [Limnohabitans sp.]
MKKIFISILFLNSLGIFAQTNGLRGNYQYDNLAYSSAINSYTEAFKNGAKSKEIYAKLGDSYYFNGNLQEANVWYKELFDLGEKVDPEYYFRYSQTLKALNDFAKADLYMSKLADVQPNDSRAAFYKANKNYKKDIDRRANRYKISPVGINSNSSEYGAYFFGDKVVYASNKSSNVLSNSRTEWTNYSATNLYLAKREDNELKEPKLISKANTRFNEDTPVFTKDLKTVYFTRNNFNKGKIGKDYKGVIKLKIYRADVDAFGKWSNIVELPFNSNEYSIAHPALSPDEKTLYFASDMPSSYGNSDIYKVSIIGNNKYGTPENLGKKVNTEGRETFPFVSENEELYFASDGHLGLGGLDVFGVKLKEGKIVSQVTNLGTPINSEMDDFAFCIDSKRTGFLSSSRAEGKGLDDIYSFSETTPIVFECKQELNGIVTDAQSGEVLSNATLQLVDESLGQAIETVQSDANGSYSFKINCEKSYVIKTEKNDYIDNKTKVLRTDEDSNIITLKVPLNRKPKVVEPIEDKKIVKIGDKEVGVGSDLAKTFEIKMIYFDLGKHNIRPDAALELTKIVDVMKEYPNMQVAVKTHTDCRSSKKSNLTLSSNRAKSIRAWMIKNGINAKRLTSKGFGESKPVNGCVCEGKIKSDCSEEEHQANRRSEFVITKL